MALTLLNPLPLVSLGQALAARLQLAFDPKLFVHAIMPARLDARAWTELTRRTPFVGLAFNDMIAAPDMQRRFRGATRWSVYLVVRNAAGPAGRYFGDAQGPGLLAMIQAATAMLQGTTLSDASSAGLGSVSVHQAANAVAEGWEDGAAAIAALDLQVPIDITLDTTLDAAGLDADALKTTAITWDFLPATGSLTDIITNTGTA